MEESLIFGDFHWLTMLIFADYLADYIGIAE